MTVHGDAEFGVFNALVGLPAGTIHGNATIQLSAAGNLTANSLLAVITNGNPGVTGPGSTIDSNASITLNLSGNLTTQGGEANFRISNESGGMIGSDAMAT